MTLSRETDRARALADARAWLSRFTPDRPLFVGEEVMRSVRREPGLADMLDRIAVIERIPR